MTLVADLSLRNRTERTIYESDRTRVESLDYNGQPCVRKTITGNGWTSALAEWLCAREVRILERLQGLEGVQQLVTRDSPNSFISRYVPGTCLLRTKNLPVDYFEKLSLILKNVHNRGVADIDFAHSTDLLVTPEGNPVIIDLAASIIYDKKNSNFLVKPAFDLICEANRRYLLRRKIRYLPEQVTQEERDLASIGVLGEFLRTVRRSSRKLSGK